ncbi:MAG: contractile injection system tape measure protein [Chitinophagaceae bacterium]
MPAKALHIIQQQVFELSAASSKNNFVWEERAAAYLHKIINPVIEACFSNLVRDDQHLVIDKLEIDLGSFSLERFEKEAAALLQEKLGSVLRSYCSASNNKENSYDQDDQPFNASKKIISRRDQEEQARFPKLLKSDQALQLALLHFLLKGRFPWWYTTETSNPTDIESLIETSSYERSGLLDEHFKLLPKQLSEKEIQELREALRSSAAARMRLANHFSAEWLAAFLQSLELAGEKALQQWTSLFDSIKSLHKITPPFHQYFWMAWTEAAFHGMHTINITLLIERVAGGYNNEAIELAKRIHEACYEKRHEAVFAGYLESIRKYFEEGSNYDAFRKKIRDEIVAGENSFTSKGIEDDPEDAIDKALDEILNSSPEQKKDKKDFGDDNALFIEAAGLVILHPFLEELFKETGLWDGEKWCDEESVYRSVQLLSWLVYGEAGLPENRLLLFKILTGLDVEEPLPATTPLTQQEINACNELLDAIVRHWKALRNTSIDGLQQGFLQREGKLSKTEKGYQLAVERKAQDVLLSHLPWGYSMIRLPWMEQIMNVTWI